jgi:hypothetical protein
LKIKLTPGTTYVTKDGETHRMGEVIELDDEAAEGLIRTGSAVRADGQSYEEDRHRRQIDRGGPAHG